MMEAQDYKCKRVQISLDCSTLGLIDLSAESMGVSRSRMLRIAFRHWLDDYRFSHGHSPWIDGQSRGGK